MIACRLAGGCEHVCVPVCVRVCAMYYVWYVERAGVSMFVCVCVCACVPCIMFGMCECEGVLSWACTCSSYFMCVRSDFMCVPVDFSCLAHPAHSFSHAPFSFPLCFSHAPFSAPPSPFFSESLPSTFPPRFMCVALAVFTGRRIQVCRVPIQGHAAFQTRRACYHRLSAALIRLSYD